MVNRIALQGALREVSNFPIFSNFSESEIANLCEGGRVELTPHRDCLFRQGEAANDFAIVLSGAFKLSKLGPTGDDTIIHFSTPGDIIGALVMTRPEPKFPVNAVAMGPSRVLKLSRNVYLGSWQHHPEILPRIQNLLSTRMGQFHKQKALFKAPLATKIASLLFEILQNSEAKDENLLPLPLTRKEIADSLGASVESVIRVMSQWSKSGIIETHDHQIRILKTDKIIEQMNTP